MDSNPISMLERPQTVRRGTLRKYTSPTRTVGAGKCFSPAAGVEKLCRIFQIDTTSFLTGCTQMTARPRLLSTCFLSCPFTRRTRACEHLKLKAPAIRIATVNLREEQVSVGAHTRRQHQA